MNIEYRKHLKSKALYSLLFLLAAGIYTSNAQNKQNTVPIRIVIDLNIGESQELILSDGKKVNLELVSIRDSVDKLNSAVRLAQAEVLVNGQQVILDAANYHLPVTIEGIQIDCPTTIAYMKNSRHSRWGLKKDARLRIWPEGSPFIEPGTFVYPLRQRIFASDTQMENDPVYVNGGEIPGSETVYYHSGLDFGGFEGKDEVLATVSGLIISSGDSIFPGYKDLLPGRLLYDEVNILDVRGWIHCFCHLFSIDQKIYPGATVKMGQKIGLLGKEGVAGGWTHLHYSVKSMQPSGKMGDENAFSYIWEAYIKQFKPSVIALARPHVFVQTNEKIHLTGSKSKSYKGNIASYEWIFSDGTSAFGADQERIYTVPGSYSEVLKVTDNKGNIDYDYTVVQVVNMEEPQKLPPTIHTVYYPTMGIKAGDPVSFGVRTFRTDSGHEEWDFGDDSGKVIVKSVVPENKRMGKYAETVHRFKNPGHYLVKVERTDHNGFKAIAHLHVVVE